jgi:hypothetical protein
MEPGGRRNGLSKEKDRPVQPLMPLSRRPDLSDGRRVALFDRIVGGADGRRLHGGNMGIVARRRQEISQASDAHCSPRRFPIDGRPRMVHVLSAPRG